MARMQQVTGWCAALAACSWVAVSAGARGKAPSGADGAELVWLDLGPVDCSSDPLIPKGMLDGYHTYRLYVRMHTYDSVNLVATGPVARTDQFPAVAPIFFPETQPFQHPAGGNTAPTEDLKIAAARIGVCIDADSYFVLGEPGAEMYFVNEPSPDSWGAALDVVWLGVPKQFGVIDPNLFGDNAWYGWIMQITVPPDTPVNGQLAMGFGDARLGTRMQIDVWDVPPLPGRNSSGKSSLGGRRATALDADGNGFLGMMDVATVLDAWGKCDATCRADVNDDGRVNQTDLAAVLRPMGLDPATMDKQAWREAVGELNDSELALLMPDRDVRSARKHLKRLYKALKG
ncbi:MAG: hypothetical protein KDA20_06260 [Phycisphaerales bacterium]|nr:hypothetical protein [Phycisphaerales bacterium]